ncbi:MAG: hypothetical protein ABJD11_11120 [Gemmatimonadota bacterium]
MSGAHDYLRGALFSPTAGVTKRPWTGILAAIDQVTSAQSPESEELLHQVLTDYKGKLQLDDDAGHCHAMPPEDLLRLIAVQTLAGWDLKGHRNAISLHANPARRDILGTIARRVLRG